jgi:NAD(P)-dependent dehydrogenase (short-subunit alcohol dehydrogenase family)
MDISSFMMVTSFSRRIIVYIVITGTSRGIGLELTHLALANGHDVLAIARKPEESPELTKLKKEFNKLEVFALDILDQDAHIKIQERIASWPCLDVLINNAGIYLGDENIDNFEKSFLTNSIKPFFIARALLSQLKRSQRPTTVQITSLMGSLEDNQSGGSYSYRASKTALNMLFKSFSVDEKWLTTLLVHPGWVQTRMGGGGATVSVKESGSGIWKLVEEAHSSQSGSFLNYRGVKLPW